MVNEALNSPVRRFDVLVSVESKVLACGKYPFYTGLCSLLCSELYSYGLFDDSCLPSFPSMMYALKKFFPLYTYDNAIAFGAQLDEQMYWWPPFQWDEESGRMRFLNWLIEQYKDDETDLRTL